MHRARRAFSLVEALVAVFLIVVALLPLLSSALSSTQLSSLVGGYSAATRMALSKLEELEAEDFSALSSGSDDVGGYSLNWVASDDASGAKVVRVTVEWSSIMGRRTVEAERLMSPYADASAP
ncbi:MAG: prepilin-type N-terminal cleavage/methylation domain-containing protein [Synergistota bacterium]|nr:prepilin-type N-terminal cleavage/methylation domain-containing protein [Synergistota bacterium]